MRPERINSRWVRWKTAFMSRQPQHLLPWRGFVGDGARHLISVDHLEIIFILHALYSANKTLVTHETLEHVRDRR